MLQSQTSCFQTSHAQQHSVHYASCSGSGGTTCAAAPCDFNWMIGCNSISNRGTTRVSVRRKPKEHWWLEPLSTVSRHLSYLLGWITRPPSSSGQHPCVDPSALIVWDTNFRNYAGRVAKLAVLCLPCEPLSLDQHKPPNNTLIIIVCEELFHKSLFWETSSFGNLWISFLFQSQHSVKNHHCDWFQCFYQLKGERLKF